MAAWRKHRNTMPLAAHRNENMYRRPPRGVAWRSCYSSGITNKRRKRRHGVNGMLAAQHLNDSDGMAGVKAKQACHGEMT